jgi:hypothetical protein
MELQLYYLEKLHIICKFDYNTSLQKPIYS